MVLGITGNIASGKSSVAREFGRLGAVVMDADQLAREVVAPGTETLDELVAAFGPDILDQTGALNREKLGAQIFSDASARQQLNAIVHPAIADLAETRLNQLRQSAEAPLIIYEAPLLFEAGAESRVDKVLVVKIDPEVQLLRLIERDALNENEAQARMDAQMSQGEKLSRADYVIDNSGSLSQMKEQVAALWNTLSG